MSTEDTTINFVTSTDDVIASQNMQSATSIIDFRSAGNCLIIGEAEQALALVDKLEPLKCTVVEIDAATSGLEKRLTENGITVFVVPTLSLQGYLGAFKVEFVGDAGTTNLAVSVYLESALFDLVLDLSPTPLMQALLPPLG